MSIEPELIRKAKAGDENAKLAIIDQCGAMIRSIATYHFGARLTADRKQDGALAVLTAIRDYDPEHGCAFASFAWIVLYRALSRSIFGNDPLVQLANPELTPDSPEFGGHEPADKFDAPTKFALARLTDQQRFVLASYLGLGCDPMTHGEIAERMGVDRSRVTHIYADAIGRLQTLLGVEAAS